MRLDPVGEDRQACEEAEAWLEQWLPADYECRRARYRFELELRTEYQRAAFDAGWLMPSWAPEHGGRSVSQEAELWIKLRFARRHAPKLPNVQGPGVAAPALMEFGDEIQRQRVRPVLRGEEWWCLGMSEPEAGSDLAALRTTATPAGDSYIIEGQKVWTSHARQSAYCLLFARTDGLQTRHRGITAFAVPMDTPGITVRPIAKIGPEDEEFCELFFVDVEVPASAIVGEPNNGWSVAMTSLSAERDMIWINNLVEIERAIELAQEAIQTRPNAALGVELTRLRADARSIWLTGMRGLANRLARHPDRETPLLKVVSTEAVQRAFALAGRIAGPGSVLYSEAAPFHGELFAGEIDALGATISGGTSEIQRNLIGERILRLPR